MVSETGYTFIIGSFIRNAKIKTVLELGVFNGFSTEAILEALPVSGKRGDQGGHLWSIDIEACSETRQRLKEFSLSNRWTFYSSTNDVEFDWNYEVDMIFIDTSHTFDHTLFELKKFSPFAKRFIFLHDTSSHPAVRKAIGAFLSDNTQWAWGEWYHHLGLALLMRI